MNNVLFSIYDVLQLKVANNVLLSIYDALQMLLFRKLIVITAFSNKLRNIGLT